MRNAPRYCSAKTSGRAVKILRTLACGLPIVADGRSSEDSSNHLCEFLVAEKLVSLSGAPFIRDLLCLEYGLIALQNGFDPGNLSYQAEALGIALGAHLIPIIFFQHLFIAFFALESGHVEGWASPGGCRWVRENISLLQGWGGKDHGIVNEGTDGTIPAD